MKISIDEQLLAVAPKLALGLVTATVQVTDHDPALWKEIAKLTAKVRADLVTEQVKDLPTVAGLREMYRRLGANPNRYRGSAEALLRRVTQGKDLYRVNTVVDINNLTSLSVRHPVGTYDLDCLSGPVTFRPGLPEEFYAGIGKGKIRLRGTPVFVDEQGPFGSPTSDSQRAMIRSTTTRIATVIIAPTGGQQLPSHLRALVTLLERHASAVDTATQICGWEGA